jgi:transcriptional regulator with XRE-family HTH domain
MRSTTTKPFGEALRELKDAQGLTYRALAETTRKLDGKGMTHAHINMLANGREKPSKRAIELLARACGVPPGYFAEYRPAASRKHRPLNQLGDAIGSTTTRPFAKAVRELKNARGLSYREIAEQSRKLDGKGITRSYLNVLQRPRAADDPGDRADRARLRRPARLFRGVPAGRSKTPTRPRTGRPRTGA